MTYFPQELMTKILEYCDDRVEQRQRRLWNSIKVTRWQQDGCNCDLGEACADRYRTTSITFLTEELQNEDSFMEWINWDNYECSANDDGTCLLETISSDEFWNDAMTNDSFRQHRRYKLSNFGKK